MTKIELLLEEGRRAFETEWGRKARLSAKAEKYMVAVGLILGFGLVRIHDRFALTGPASDVLGSWLAVGSLLAMSFSFSLCLLALRTRTYRSYPRGNAIADSIKDKSVSDEAAMVMLAKMYLTARDANVKVNDRRAVLASWAGMLLISGFVLAAASYLAAVL